MEDISVRPLVLVVDDADDNRDLYADFLALNGFQVIVASDGAEALHLARRDRPSVVVMDMALPVMDGWEATRRLKSDDATRRMYVIAVTGRTEPRYRDRCWSAGCDAFLAKPCPPAQLLAEIREAMGS